MVCQAAVPDDGQPKADLSVCLSFVSKFLNPRIVRLMTSDESEQRFCQRDVCVANHGLFTVFRLNSFSTSFVLGKSIGGVEAFSREVVPSAVQQYWTRGNFPSS